MNAPFALSAAEIGVSPAPAGLLRFITCGSVDDGKSTLIGRLLHDSGAVPEDQLAALHSESRRFGTQGDALDLALLVDGLAAEREQGITIDVAYRYFSTKRRAFIVADTPGHEQYTRNMATGASGADLAIILVDARKGVLPQTRRHSFIVSMVGVRRIVVAINKMDLVGYDEGVFHAIADNYREATRNLGFEEIVFIPVSALRGDNIAGISPNMPWHRGPALIDHLESVDASFGSQSKSMFRMPVQWVNRPDANFRGFSGSIASGVAHVEQDVRILPSGVLTRVSGILGASGQRLSALRDEAVTLVLRDEVDASRGDVIVAADDTIRPARVFDGRLLWMSEGRSAGQNLILQQGAAIANATLAIRTQFDVDTFEERSADSLPLNGIGRVRIRSDKPLVVAPYTEDRTLGAFILVDRITNDTVALGVIDAVCPEEQPPRPTHANMRRKRSILRRLLAPDSATTGGFAEAVSWRVFSALAAGALTGIATGDIAAAFIVVAGDFMGRLALRATHRQLFLRAAGRRRMDPEQNADGAGI